MHKLRDLQNYLEKHGSTIETAIRYSIPTARVVTKFTKKEEDDLKKKQDKATTARPVQLHESVFPSKI